MSDSNNNSENVQFLSIAQFKSQLGIDSARVLKNEKTGKIFLSASNGESYKVQQDINSGKEMKMLVADGNMADACLVNVSNQATEVFSI